jgi:hypothetical protein
LSYLVLFAGTPIGRVSLDAGEPAAGLLEPLPGYTAMAPTFQAAGDLLWQARFPRRPAWSPAATALLAAADRGRAALSLSTEAGTPVPVAALDLWADTRSGDPPFVLVQWREQPAAMPAVVRPRPAGPGDAHAAA